MAKGTISRLAGLALASAAALVIAAPCLAQGTAAGGDGADACRRLADLIGADAHLDAVRYVPEGALPPPFPGMPKIMGPAHCQLTATIRPRTGVGGQKFGLGFELRLPMAWNGRFLFQGGGGLDGNIRSAIGFNFSGGPTALARGFAIVSTDAGHEGPDASFATDQQARLDYAYVALGEVTRRAKAIVSAFYGKAPSYSYFDGCSNGGRQGMMAASRYPELFDGIVAGDPGFRLSRAAVGEAWATAQFARIARRDAAGLPILSTAVTDQDLSLVSQAILKACDAKDGLVDGIVGNWQACRFRVEALRCRPGLTACLAPAKIATLVRVFDGARDSRGRPLYAGWLWDPGISSPAWRSWTLGTSPTSRGNSAAETLGADALGRYFSTPAYPAPLTPFEFDFDQAEERVAETGAVNDPTGTLLTSFTQHGGKLLIYHGLADPVFSAVDIVAWFDRLQRTMGPTPAWARLFLVPGMNHCALGPATDRFDALRAVQLWVEEGQAPDRIEAAGSAVPGKPIHRPLCPYPAYAHYVRGPVENAESFECRTERTGRVG
ncbi:MAG TPA: DUF6351 family protein [Sphingomonas sp.]|nr:DUF6351 family protein [Sphingomonas sp.]